MHAFRAPVWPLQRQANAREDAIGGVTHTAHSNGRVQALTFAGLSQGAVETDVLCCSLGELVHLLAAARVPELVAVVLQALNDLAVPVGHVRDVLRIRVADLHMPKDQRVCGHVPGDKRICNKSQQCCQLQRIRTCLGHSAGDWHTSVCWKATTLLECYY